MSAVLTGILAWRVGRDARRVISPVDDANAKAPSSLLEYYERMVAQESKAFER